MGGHYIATSTLQDTCYGIFHSFINRDYLTNNDHVREVFMLLARMVAFYSTSLMGSESSEDDRFRKFLFKCKGYPLKTHIFPRP